MTPELFYSVKTFKTLRISSLHDRYFQEALSKQPSGIHILFKQINMQYPRFKIHLRSQF